jgi:DNA-binding IclR family transcriptional regulator
MPRTERNPYIFQSVDRALRLLELVANEPQPKTVRELAALSGYERTMTYRLLSTLEARKFLERDPVTDAYSLGLAATSLSNPAAHNAALVRSARPELERLMHDLGQTISLAISQHDAGVVIDQIDPPNPIRLMNNVNVPLPLHCTSNGKIVLARMSDGELDAFLRGPLQKLTPRTITSPTQLRRELVKVRADGFASAVEELAEGVTGLSVELTDDSGEFLATISVSGPTWQLPAENFPKQAKRMHRAARAIARELS